MRKLTFHSKHKMTLVKSMGMFFCVVIYFAKYFEILIFFLVWRLTYFEQNNDTYRVKVLSLCFSVFVTSAKDLNILLFYILMHISRNLKIFSSKTVSLEFVIIWTQRQTQTSLLCNRNSLRTKAVLIIITH